MSGLEINNDEVVSRDNIAPGVCGLRIMLVNVYAIFFPEGWLLVDAGLPMSHSQLYRWGESKFPRKKPLALLLTHGHFDHVGSLPNLFEFWDVPVFAHEAEFPYLQGKSKYPPPNVSAGGGIMSLLAPFYPRGPIDLGERLQPLPSDGSIPYLDDWKWLHTPGHTEGHVSFFRERDRTLIVGDAFCTTKQESLLSIAAQTPELHGPPAYYTSDWNAAKASVERLAALEPRTVAAGHGSPMSGPHVAPALDVLARDFDEVARPHGSRRAA
jgi:glyoxylase-like metal-dependent hydrolase (beta-lactamase superfamily II)